MTPEEISERFDISMSAARVRAAEIARLGRRQSGKLRPLPAGGADFLRSQKEKGFHVTSVEISQSGK
jgi:hypothetical protein